MIFKKLLPAFLPVLFIACACAVDPEDDTDYFYDRVMKAWINVNHPGLKPYGEQGAYILDMDRGTGSPVSDSSYVWVHYVKRTLDGTISSTNIQDLAEQLGTYTISSWYGSNIWRVDQGYVPKGLEEVIKTMRAGGHATIAVPRTASTHTSSNYKAFNSTQELDNTLFDVTIDTIVTDINAYQEAVMREWFQAHFSRTDTLINGLYFQKLDEKTADSDTIPEGSSIKVRYIGRLLNGQVFDTNIEDTAKFYRIWNASTTYEALSFEFNKSEDNQQSGSNSYVAGFQQAVLHMNYGETALTLFNSTLGYGDGGSAPSIPEYAPLIFWLYIEPK